MEESLLKCRKTGKNRVGLRPYNRYNPSIPNLFVNPTLTEPKDWKQPALAKQN